eukprot:CAMPEP_0195614636 /NCGR_PEP_ID=MMETSP0815-20121206/12043_1 /TAXON_ID=97485 /ORGANISM="Prymnesium parvum, Strain Texoma1" /LENGTH=90 /DNA_ID=CAMNT_0040754895 /DNA_START=395 /DNA_END=667 /DNA_ORIENTATION=+
MELLPHGSDIHLVRQGGRAQGAAGAAQGAVRRRGARRARGARARQPRRPASAEKLIEQWQYLQTVRPQLVRQRGAAAHARPPRQAAGERS